MHTHTRTHTPQHQQQQHSDLSLKDLLLSLNTPTPLFLFMQGSGNVFRHFSCLLRYIFSDTCCAGYPPVAPPASFALLLCGLLWGWPKWMISPGPFAFWLPIELGQWGDLAGSRRKRGEGGQVLFPLRSLPAELSAWVPAATASTPCHVAGGGSSSQVLLDLGYFHTSG